MPNWPLVVSTLAAIALLLSFLLVVRHAVAQGSLRRATMAADDTARWQCGARRGATDRRDCPESSGRPAPALESPAHTLASVPSPNLASIPRSPP